MHNSQPYIRPRRLESIRVIITENGESESYGVEDGGLFVEMVVTNEMISEKKTISLVRFKIFFIYISSRQKLKNIGGDGTFIAYLSATCRI